MPVLTDLLRPYLAQPLSPRQTTQVVLYLDLLLKWNAKISLTAVRTPEEIMGRHFGESFFAGQRASVVQASSLIDLGSGAGFPGLPMAILAPETEVTLIESQQKKVAFLREVARALELDNVSVYAGRAEDAKRKSQMVTMRAVEKFERALATAASLVESGGTLVLLIGNFQAGVLRALPDFRWIDPIPIPHSRERILIMGNRAA